MPPLRESAAGLPAVLEPLVWGLRLQEPAAGFADRSLPAPLAGRLPLADPLVAWEPLRVLSTGFAGPAFQRVLVAGREPLAER